MIAELAARPILREAALDLARRLPAGLQAPLATLAAGANRLALERRRGPARLILMVTRSCPQRCPFCLLAPDRDLGDELTAAQHQAVAASLPAPLPLLLLTGGEPLLREDLVAVAGAYVREAGTRQVTLVTTGAPVERAVDAARGILALHLGVSLAVHVALDGLPANHDALRGTPGLGAQALDTVRRLRGLDPRRLVVTVQSTLGPDNLAGFDALAALVRDELRVPHKLQLRRGAGEVFDLPAEVAGYWPETPGLDAAERAAVLDLADELYADDTRVVTRRLLALLRLADQVIVTGQRPFPCTAGRFDAVLWPEGELSVCEACQPFVDLRELVLDLGRAWRSPAADRARALTAGCACTLPCHLTSSLLHDAAGLQELLR